MKSLSFDGLVKFYDETRVFDADCFTAALSFLVGKFPPQKFSSVLEPGIGTGRIAIPLAQRGYQVVGVDISEEMLAMLKTRLTDLNLSLPISFQEADVTSLPLASATFDAVVTTHLFYFIRNWKEAIAEILRVVRDGGPTILIHTGMGMEIPLLNQRYKELCAEQGCPINSVGIKSTREVVDYCEHIGCRVEQVRNRWQWTAHIRLKDALGYMKARAYSFTTFAPNTVHSVAIERLACELQQQYEDLSTEIEVPNQIYIVVVRQAGTEAVELDM